MKLVSLLSFFFFFFLLFVFCSQRELGEALSTRGGHANCPPRGWNSYDSFSWIISEQEFLQNAEVVSRRLLGHGYQYVVVDFLWYRRKVPGAYTDSLGFDVIDKWGRVIPDPQRWPSSKNGKGFTEVAKKVHGMGLKFGIHVMRGISTQAVNANTPILDVSTGRAYTESGRFWYAKDIGLKDRACAWMPHGFMSVDTNLGAARAFLRSLYTQYAEWGVDFVKHDCIFGDDLNVNEITIVSEVLKELNRPILYSLSPGTSATPTMAKDVSALVNMYRITGDDWDSWGDVAAHFNVSRDFAAAHMIGDKGLRGTSWPDLDMLPIGWLTDPGSNDGPHRKSKLNLDEQRTQMTLWSMAKSPLMFGGDLRKLDSITYESRRPKEMTALASHVLHLTSCKDHKAKGWVSEVLDNELERICWKDSRRNYRPPFCLYKRKPLVTVASDDEILHKQKYQGKHHLLALDSMESCLDASPKTKLTSQELKSSLFSPCRWDANQMWELNINETLVNSYSGLCGVVKNAKANVNSGGIRSWVATGRRGEIYLSFFNLSSRKMVISAKVSDLNRVHPWRSLHQGSCTYREVWTGKDYGVAKETISLAVAKHGCALLVLRCSP
ncbi:hypothetical protein AQUCO_01100466v1 [Aquilegia coerulea]|uniref:Alpha-galactosidase n=1 Tax=Aquilegia coerulea TaxID=218851 RepID=A0A2G5E799_AQUCA|nr:hypothetical protein AQUCO_01100466v1 [Aquilegia coerulea]